MDNPEIYGWMVIVDGDNRVIDPAATVPTRLIFTSFNAAEKHAKVFKKNTARIITLSEYIK